MLRNSITYLIYYAYIWYLRADISFFRSEKSALAGRILSHSKIKISALSFFTYDSDKVKHCVISIPSYKNIFLHLYF